MHAETFEEILLPLRKITFNNCIYYLLKRYTLLKINTLQFAIKESLSIQFTTFQFVKNLWAWKMDA